MKLFTAANKKVFSNDNSGRTEIIAKTETQSCAAAIAELLNEKERKLTFDDFNNIDNIMIHLTNELSSESFAEILTEIDLTTEEFDSLQDKIKAQLKGME